MELFGGALPTGSDKRVLSTSATRQAQSRIRHLQLLITRILVPSFLSRDEKHARIEPRHTDFLDGMRGYAAFCVYCCHFFLPTHPQAHMAYGGNDGVDDYWIPQLPIIRLIYSGNVSVCLFFVISGFSISLRPLDLARKGSYAAFFDTMNSAIFRRLLRLYVPCLAMLCVTFVLACLGAFDFMYALTKQWPFLSRPLRVPMVHDTMGQQFGDFAGQVWDWADPLNKKNKHIPYGVQLWTIPVELRCSLISFVTIIGLAKVTPRMRMGILAAMGIYLESQRHPEVTLFLAGSILAELYLIREEHLASLQFTRSPETRAQKTRASMLFVFGLFLASYPPVNAEKARFWSLFRWIAIAVLGTEDKDVVAYFFSILASMLLVYIASRSQFLQGVFTTPLGRYLGKTSFSLYCVHQALINWFGYRSILFWWSMTGSDSVWRYEVGIGIAFVFQTAVTFCAADIFWRLVDAPCVDFTKWVEKKCVVEEKTHA
jgi:peptidoglycan/LPS O-acetylase OafA/YrhL